MSYSLGDHSYTRTQFARELSPLGFKYPTLTSSHDNYLWGLDNYVDDILAKSRAQTELRDSYIDEIKLENKLNRAMSEIRDTPYLPDSTSRRARSEIREPTASHYRDYPAFSYKARAQSETRHTDPNYRFLSQGYENSTPWASTGGYYYPSCPHYRVNTNVGRYLDEYAAAVRSEVLYNLEIPYHLRWRDGDISTSLHIEYPESYRGTSSTYSPSLGRYNYYWDSPSRYYRYSEYPYKYGYPTYPTRYVHRYQSNLLTPQRYSYYPRYQSRFYR